MVILLSLMRRVLENKITRCCVIFNYCMVKELTVVEKYYIPTSSVYKLLVARLARFCSPTQSPS